MSKVVLRPLAMRKFNSRGIYQLSKLRQDKEVNYQTFVNQYADNPIKMLVSFNDDNSNPQEITAYNQKMRGCYIVHEID